MTDRISLAAQRDAVQLEIDFRTREYADFIREKHRLASIYRDTPTSEIKREVDLVLRLAQMKAVLASLEQLITARDLIAALCNMLHDIAPDEGDERAEVEALIAEAAEWLDSIIVTQSPELPL